MIYVVIGAGAALGANARFLIGLYIAQVVGTAFPYATMLINISGSLVIGFFITLITERLEVDVLWRLFFVTGFLGGYTTFSTYSVEAVGLFRQGQFGPGLVYAIGSVAGGLLGVLLGSALASWIGGIGVR